MLGLNSCSTKAQQFCGFLCTFAAKHPNLQPPVNLIQRAHYHTQRTAINDENGSYTYGQLLQQSGALASMLLQEQPHLQETRVAFLCTPGFGYVAAQWAVWRAGGIAVPLSAHHPLPEINYILHNCGATILLYEPVFETLLAPVLAAGVLRAVCLPASMVSASGNTRLPFVLPKQKALILYTSGTTGKPKGVVLTHLNLEAQIMPLIDAWQWQPDDYILHTLPLHHTHGIVNALCCALWQGACCHFLPAFDAAAVWRAFLQLPVTLFMGVPAMYQKLITYYWQQTQPMQQLLSAACSKLRLMVSGSAALPVNVLQTFQQISGHTLLERYGMTEIGMALSNPYKGERLPGLVGKPLPGGVTVRITDENNHPLPDGETGELQVKGDAVFLEYWQNPEATRQAFTPDGWFKTGDMVRVQEGNYRIAGRISTDIIKTGGYKVSAPEIEEMLRNNPYIADCAVVAIPHEQWGEAVSAAVVLHTLPLPVPVSEMAAFLRQWCKTQMATYKTPVNWLFLDQLPRNAMGKIVKPHLKQLFLKQNEG